MQPFHNRNQSSRKEEVKLIIYVFLYINHMFTCAIQADNLDGSVAAKTNRALMYIFNLEKLVIKGGDLNSYWTVLIILAQSTKSKATGFLLKAGWV